MSSLALDVDANENFKLRSNPSNVARVASMFNGGKFSSVYLFSFFKFFTILVLVV